MIYANVFSTFLILLLGLYTFRVFVLFLVIYFGNQKKSIIFAADLENNIKQPLKVDGLTTEKNEQLCPMKRVYYKRFVPKSSPIQPNEYRIVGLSYDAVFSIETRNKKYLAHPQDCCATLYIELGCHDDRLVEWDSIEVLIQCYDCRRVLYRAKSLRDALKHLETIIDKVKGE